MNRKTRFFQNVLIILIVFCLVSSMFPLQTTEINVSNVFAEGIIAPLGDELSENWWIYPELQPYQIFNAPQLNWSKFWQVFKNHAMWDLEYRDGEDWISCKENLTIIRDYLEDNTCKFTLDFTAPYTADYRLTLAVDYRVKEYVNRSGQYEYTLTYETFGESFNVIFNWSDIAGISGIIITHGIKNVEGHDYFWFRARRNNVPEGYHVVLDPTYEVFSGINVYTSYPFSRKLVRSSTGELWCVFYELNDVHIANSSDYGVTWTDLEIYGAHLSSYPSVAIDSNDVIHFIWAGNHEGQLSWRQIRYVNSSDWTNIINLTDDSSYPQTGPVIAIDSNDKIHIVWEKGYCGTSNDDQMAYINSTDGGATWSEKQILTDELNSGDDTWNPSIAIDSTDSIHIVFQCEDFANGYDQILHMKSDDSGSSWSDWDGDAITNDASHNQRYLSSAIDDNDVLHVTWYGYQQANGMHQIAYSYNDSSGWSTVEWLTNHASISQFMPSIAIDSNNYVHIVWDGKVDGMQYIYNDTSSWSVNTTIADWDIQYPNLICAQHPTVGGYKTNRPKTGYAVFFGNQALTNATYINGSVTWDAPAPPNTAPTITSWNADTEPGATSGWDWDNDDLQVDWVVADDDSDTLTLLWTFSLGGTPDDPETGSYNGRKTGIESGSYTMTNQDLNWDSGTWEDHDGVVNFKFRLHDGTEYSTTIETDTLAEGIDGTNPTGTVDEYGTENPDSIEGDSADVTSGVASNDITIKDTTDNDWWTGSEWGSETWLDCTGTTTWSYDSSGVDWDISHEITVTLRIYDVAGNVDASADTEDFTTESALDTTAPTITINFAGNLSDSGGSYWRPPGESTQLTGVWSDGYYTNDSRQSEGWMYINLTVEDSGGVPNVWLQWKNESTWTNYIYAFLNTTGGFFEFNTSGNISTAEGYNYSFNVVANDTTGNSNWVGWNKTGIGGGLTRRYVQLNCSKTNITYTPFYFYDAVYSASDQEAEDRLHHDQGTDGTTLDAGYLLDDTPTGTVHNRYCISYIGYWFDENICPEPLTLDNIYYHFWWSTNDNAISKVGWHKTRDKFEGTVTDYYSTDSSNSRSSISYDGLSAYDTYYLDTNLLDMTDTSFTDNDIYELNVVAKSPTLGTQFPSIINNRSFTSFILLNVPDNATLNASHADTDSDGLSDWTELYVIYTNPFVADTDNDSVNDYHETLSGSDPNDYTDTKEPAAIWIDITNATWDLGNIVMSSSIWTNETGKTFIADKDNCTVATDLKLQITNDGVDWTAATDGNSPDADTYRLNASIDSWSTEFQIVTASATTISENIATNQNETFDLRFDTPTSSSTGDQQSITVTASLVQH